MKKLLNKFILNKSMQNRMMYHTLFVTGFLPLINMNLANAISFGSPYYSTYIYMFLYIMVPIATTYLFSFERNE